MIKNLNKYFLTYIFYTIMATTIIALVYYFNNAKEQLLLDINLNKKITKLMLLNKNFDVQMGNKINHLNFDLPKNDIEKFENILYMIEKNRGYKTAASDKIITKSFLNINNSFLGKKSFLEKYKSYSAIINNSLRYLPILGQEIDSHKNIQISSYVNTLHFYILQLNLNEQISNGEFLESIGLLKAIKNSDKELNQKINLFISHVLVVYQNYNNLRVLLKKSDELSLDKEIEKFSQLINSYLNTTIHKATNMAYFLLIALFLFSLLGGFIYHLKRKSEVMLSYFKEGVDKSDNSIILTDKNRKIIYANEAFEKTTGYERKEILGKNPRVLKSDIKNKQFYDDLHLTLKGGKRWFGEFTNRKKDGTIFYEKASIIPIFNQQKEPQFYMAIKLDITQDKEYKKSIEEKNKEITKRYYYDSLTSLPNRNKIIEDLKQLRQNTLVLINIDALKGINDFYGLKNGDIVIQEVAKSLKKIHIKDAYTLYKLNSDEFAMVIKRDLNKIQTVGLIDNIERVILDHDIYTSCNQKIIFTVTMGISYSTNENALIDADAALKHAKINKNSFEIFSKNINMSQEYKNNILWISKIKNAIRDDRIIPYFQPIVDSKTGEVYYYEALVRLIERDGNVISPFFFLDISKKGKLYSSLTKIVIEKSFDVFENSDNSFSINFSYDDMINEDIVKLLGHRLKRCKNPENFIAEIVETESFSNYEVAKRFIGAIKVFGCKVAIDDFGSGYSNFARLFELNVDYLKIDGSIIKNIDSQEQLKIITATIVEFAKKSKMNVVAEFVHSKEIENILKELDIRFMQGYHFSPPIKNISEYKIKNKTADMVI